MDCTAQVLKHYSTPPKRCHALEPLHRFNNFVKACLIQRFLKPAGHVLDMPCGRGGDLNKFRKNQASHYFGIDIVPEQVEEARARHSHIQHVMPAQFLVADFTKPLGLSPTHNLVTCQFALHYAWGSEEHAIQALRNAAEAMACDAHLILTFPDHKVIEKLITDVINYKSKDTHNNWVKRDKNEVYTYHIGGPHHHLEFKSLLWPQDFVKVVGSKPFGLQYMYYQEGAIAGVPEFVINQKSFSDTCYELGLETVYEGNFEDFKRECPFADGQSFSALRDRMSVPCTLDAESDAIACLYRAVVLRKEEDQSSKRQRRQL